MVPKPTPLTPASPFPKLARPDWGAVEQELRAWLAVPPANDEGTPLVPATIQIALDLLPQLHAMPVPDRLLPAADGGIVIEWHAPDAETNLQIWSDGQAELLHFTNGRLQSRRQLIPAK
jgi:hypothetical protein